MQFFPPTGRALLQCSLSIVALGFATAGAMASDKVELNALNSSVETMIYELFEQHAASLERSEEEIEKLHEIVQAWYTFEEGELPESLHTQDFMEWYNESVSRQLADLQYIDRDPDRVREQAVRGKAYIQQQLDLIVRHGITREEAMAAVEVLRPLLADAKQSLAVGVTNTSNLVLSGPAKAEVEQLTGILVPGYYDERSIRAGQAGPEMYGELLVGAATRFYFQSEMEAASIRVEDWFVRMMGSVIAGPQLVLGARDFDGLGAEAKQYLESSAISHYGARPSTVWFFYLSRAAMHELGGDDLPAHGGGVSLGPPGRVGDSGSSLMIENPAELFQHDLADFTIRRPVATP